MPRHGRTTKVRAAYSRDSQRIGVVERGELVKTTEERTDELGRPQLHLSWPLKGWVSEITSSGDVAFCSAEPDDLSSSNDDVLETRNLFHGLIEDPQLGLVRQIFFYLTLHGALPRV